jgi:hypothetical protein
MSEDESLKFKWRVKNWQRSLLTGLLSRAARFFLTQYTKTGKTYQITTKIPNDHKIYQIAIKYIIWP